MVAVRDTDLTVCPMRKFMILLLFPLAACSTSPAADTTSSSALPASSSTVAGAPVSTPAGQTPPTAVPTPPPLDIKSGQVIELLGDPSQFGPHLSSVSYVNSILASTKRYLGGEPVTLEVLTLADDYMKSTVPLSRNVIERVTSVEGDRGIKVVNTIKGEPRNNIAIAYVCLLNGGAYASLSPCG